jgi:hypothetical protein
VDAHASRALVDQVRRLREEITGLKRTIARTRDALHAKKRELVALEADCHRRGISLVIVHPHGEGDIHGQPRS